MNKKEAKEEVEVSKIPPENVTPDWTVYFPTPDVGKLVPE